MTDEYLTTIDEARHRPVRDRTNPVPSTEAVGDPDAHSTSADGQAGAAAGVVLGSAVAGPIGTIVGAVVGGIAGTAGERADLAGPAARDTARRASQLRRHAEAR